MTIFKKLKAYQLGIIPHRWGRFHRFKGTHYV